MRNDEVDSRYICLASRVMKGTTFKAGSYECRINSHDNVESRFVPHETPFVRGTNLLPTMLSRGIRQSCDSREDFIHPSSAALAFASSVSLYCKGGGTKYIMPVIFSFYRTLHCHPDLPLHLTASASPSDMPLCTCNRILSHADVRACFPCSLSISLSLSFSLSRSSSLSLALTATDTKQHRFE